MLKTHNHILTQRFVLSNFLDLSRGAGPFLSTLNHPACCHGHVAGLILTLYVYKMSGKIFFAITNCFAFKKFA